VKVQFSGVAGNNEADAMREIRPEFEISDGQFASPGRRSTRLLGFGV